MPTRREVMAERRLTTLRTALVALRIKQDEPELRLVHRLQMAGCAALKRREQD